MIRKTALVDGLSVSYVDQGNGPDLLLLHGWGAPAETYKLVIAHLSKTYRVIAPDLPGFGGSSEPKTPFSVDDYVDFVLHFCEKATCNPTVVLGHSYGGRILIKMLSRSPVPLDIQKAVLMDAAGIMPKHGFVWHAKVYSYKAMKKLFPALAEKRKNKVGSADYRSASDVMRQTMVLAVNEDLTALLPKIQTDVCLIWGEDDDATPISDGKTMEEKIPHASLTVIPHAGHFVFLDKWVECRAALDKIL